MNYGTDFRIMAQLWHRHEENRRRRERLDASEWGYYIGYRLLRMRYRREGSRVVVVVVVVVAEQLHASSQPTRMSL